MNTIQTDYEKIERKAKICGTVQKTFTYFLLAVWALIVLFPFYWMVLTSIKSYGAYNAEYIPRFITLSPTSTWPPGNSHPPLNSP